MDILMIYWNSVWTNSKRDRASLLAGHSGAELQAYERALHGTPRARSSRGTPRPRTRAWQAGGGRQPNAPH